MKQTEKNDSPHPASNNVGTFLSAVSIVAFALPWGLWLALSVIFSAQGTSNGEAMGAAVGLAALWIASLIVVITVGVIAVVLLGRERKLNGAWPSSRLWTPVAIALIYPSVLAIVSIFGYLN